MRVHYSHRGFVGWMLEACFLAAVTIYVPAFALGYPGWSLSSPENGDPGVDSISLTAMSLVCICVNLRLAIELHSWHVLEHTFMWGSIIAIEFFCIVFSYVRYPVETWPVSYSWNSLNSVVAHVWDAFPYWLVSVLVVVLVLAPRTLGKAWTKLFADSGAHKVASTAAHNAGASSKLLKSLSTAQMHRPSTQEMARYNTELGANLVAVASDQSMREAAQQAGDAVRINASVYAPPPPPSSACSMTSQISSAAYSASSSCSVGAAGFVSGQLGPGRAACAPSPQSMKSRDKRETRSAFSNDDKTSARVLASGGRVSLGAYPVSLDTDEEVTPPHGEPMVPVGSGSHGGQGGHIETEMGELR